MKITAFSPVDAMYRHVTSDGIREVTAGGRTLLSIDAGALTHLAEQAFHNVSYFLRSSHLAQWRAILDDPEASHNDKFVAEALLRNAVISSEGYLPLCQDTGTATVVALRGSNILTDGDDAKHLEAGIRHAYERNDLRYSQIVPRSMFAEANSGNNLPPQIDIQLGPEDGYRFLFVAKGGGSSNKTTLIQGSKALLNDEALTSLLTERIAALGVAACPPYHLAVVIGGTSPEENLKVLKLASAHALDHLEGPSETGAMFRDRTWEEKVMAIAAASGLGAQFGGRYLALDARVIRLPRHAGSCPISIGVSCSAHRNILGHITRDGAFLEELEPDPVIYIAGPKEHRAGVHVEIGDSMDETVAALDGHAPGTLVYLSGTLVVARDMAHARLYEMLREGKPLPEYFKQWPVYYAGPAKTPPGEVIGSFGPTTAQRMDEYMEPFMAAGASRVTLAKGNRAPSVTASCARHNGFYLGTIGGAAAVIAQKHIVTSELLDFPDLGMEAIRKIRVKDLPAFIITNNNNETLY